MDSTSTLTSLLLLLSTFLHHAASTCLPRNFTTLHLNTIQGGLQPSAAPSPAPDLSAPSPSSQTFSTVSSPISDLAQMPTLPTAAKGTCDRTTYPELCQSSLTTYLPSLTEMDDPDVDMESILEMHLKMGKAQTKLAWDEFDALAKDGSEYEATLKSCKQRYKEAIDGFSAALQALSEKDISSVQINLDAVLQGYEDCGAGDDAPGDPTADSSGPWTKYNNDLRKLTDNCFDLAKFLK